jgi:hypothetical protein
MRLYQRLTVSAAGAPERHIFTSVLLCKYAINETLSKADESLKGCSSEFPRFDVGRPDLPVLRASHWNCAVDTC